jgi:hypothetical protein
VGGDLMRSSRWRTLAASVAGTAHAGSGRPCADACAVRSLRLTGTRTLLVAVAADGAGASARAPQGARLACEAVLAEAERWTRRLARGGRRTARRGLATFGSEEAILWADAARKRIAAAARAEGLDPRLFACTLLAAVVDERRAVFFQVGDGAIVYRHADGGYRPALWPQSGEYANCTWFVTDEDLASRVQSTSVEDVHEIALLTDGLQGLALRFLGREAHGPFFEPMFAQLRRERETRRTRLRGELRAFLQSPAVNRRTDDDKTLVLATRLPATLAAPSVVEAAS